MSNAEGWNPPEWGLPPIDHFKGNALQLSTLAVNYDNSKELQPTIEIEQLTERFDYNGFLWLRVNPIDVKVKPSIGTIKEGEIRTAHFYESLNFSNSKSVKTKHPNPINLVITSGMMLKQQIDIYGNLEIVEFTQDIYYNPETDQIEADEPFYGGITVQYDILFKILYYAPKTIVIPYAGGGIAALTVYIGDIYIWKKLAVQVHTLTLATDKDHADYNELYKVTSKIVLDPEGTWEYPPNWESTYNANKDLPQGSSQRAKYALGEFPNTAHKIDPDVSFTDERLHKTGKYNFMGQVFHQSLKPDSPFLWYAPYQFDTTYHPEYTLTWTKPTWKEGMSYEDELFFESFWRIDFEGIYEDLRNDFPDLVNEGIK